jgi:hypothetical protein
VAAAHGKADRCRSGRREAAVGFGSGARELAKGLEERNVEACVVLVRVRDRGLRLRGGLSSVMMRWRPAGARGAVARVGQDSEEGKEIRGMEKTTRGRTGSKRWTMVVCTAAAEGGAAPVVEQKSRGAEDRGGLEEEEEREEVTVL